MGQRKKVARASDGLVKAAHLRQAQATMLAKGPSKVLAQIGQIEPEIAMAVEVAAKEIAASAMFDSEMSRAAAHILRERVMAMALGIFSAHYLAVWEFYRDLMQDTPVAELNAEFDAPPPPAPEEWG